MRHLKGDAADHQHPGGAPSDAFREESHQMPLLESPRNNLCGGGCLVAGTAFEGLEPETPSSVGASEADWLRAKREEDEEYLLYLKSQSADGVPLVKL
ncbi:unnamed protein product [Effrenium voratum]|uniref:Uncharacterized protein n=1 Tax=Effrenium voratum TaxID=2562239 RepID=A0AA36JHL3_9DINO|nr:unnamed protein product [Effrenium voratum]